MVRQQVAREIKEHAKSRGNVPGGWERWANELLEPQVDWRRELNSVVRRASATVAGRKDYTYARPSRRSAALPNVVLPAMRQPRPPEVACVLDTSGSMSATMLSQCLAEIGEIIRRVSSAGNRVKVINCDASANEAQAVRSLEHFSLLGGGGTDMRVGMVAASKLKPRPDIVIVLTDGETPWPTEPPADAPNAKYVAVLVAGDPHYSQPPSWMHRIQINEEYLERGRIDLLVSKGR